MEKSKSQAPSLIKCTESQVEYIEKLTVALESGRREDDLIKRIKKQVEQVFHTMSFINTECLSPIRELYPSWMSVPAIPDAEDSSRIQALTALLKEKISVLKTVAESKGIVFEDRGTRFIAMHLINHYMFLNLMPKTGVNPGLWFRFEFIHISVAISTRFSIKTIKINEFFNVIK